MSFPGEFLLVRPDGELRVDTAQRSNRRAEFRQRATAPQSVASLFADWSSATCHSTPREHHGGKVLEKYGKSAGSHFNQVPVNLHPPLPLFF
jgi:hypothetical protein